MKWGDLPLGVGTISGVGVQKKRCSTYTVEIVLSDTMSKLNGIMIEAPDIGGVDILIGMDIITMAQRVNRSRFRFPRQ